MGAIFCSFRRDGVLAFLLICISFVEPCSGFSEGTQTVICRTYIDYARKVVGHIPIQESLWPRSWETGPEGELRRPWPPE